MIKRYVSIQATKIALAIHDYSNDGKIKEEEKEEEEQSTIGPIIALLVRKNGSGKREYTYTYIVIYIYIFSLSLSLSLSLSSMEIRPSFYCWPQWGFLLEENGRMLMMGKMRESNG